MLEKKYCLTAVMFADVMEQAKKQIKAKETLFVIRHFILEVVKYASKK